MTAPLRRVTYRSSPYTRMASVMRLQRDQTGRSQLQQYKMREYYVVETLECGHTLEGRRGKSNRATARRCEKCVAVVQ